MVFTKQQVDEIYRKEHKRTIGRFEPVEKKSTGWHYDWYQICGNFKPHGEIDEKYNPEQFYEEGEVILGGVGEHFLYPDYQEGDIMDACVSPNPPKRLHNFIHGVFAGDYYQNLCDIKLDDEENTPEEIVDLFYKWKEYWLAKRQEECDSYEKQNEERKRIEPWILREQSMRKVQRTFENDSVRKYYIFDEYNGVLWPRILAYPNKEDEKLWDSDKFLKQYVTEFTKMREAWLKEVKRQESIPGYLSDNFDDENFKEFNNDSIFKGFFGSKEEMKEDVKTLLKYIDDERKILNI